MNKSLKGPGDETRSLYRWHAQGAVVRSLGSFAMWLTCLGAYGVGLVPLRNLVTDTFAVAYLILMNPPLLWVLRRIERPPAADCFGILINFLEIIGYTAVIYALGGVEAGYLLPIYAALVTYVGVKGPGVRPFLVAGLCSLAFGALLTLEHLALLPSLRINPNYIISWPQQLAILGVTATLLMIVAFISSYTASLINRHRAELARQNVELQQALRKAQESDRLKSEFLANVSHELRTPLNAIIGFSELLKEGHLGPLSSGQREALRDVHASGEHLLAVINDLLDLSKVAAGQMELNRSKTDLPALLQESVRVFQERSREKGLALVAALEECPATIEADGRRLTQILYNLLSNALKFTPSGGKIRLSARGLTWERGLWRTAAGEAAALPFPGGEQGVNSQRIVEIRLSDTGIGLNAQDRERIFNPFEQADGSIRRRYEGTGLGLSLTRKFAELHGGRVWAESEGENHGSTFHVVLPLCCPPFSSPFPLSAGMMEMH